MTTTDEQMSIWNFTNKEKIFAFNFKQELNAITISILPTYHLDFPSFAFLVNNQESDGNIYIFSNSCLIDIEGGSKTIIQEVAEDK